MGQIKKFVCGVKIGIVGKELIHWWEWRTSQTVSHDMRPIKANFAAMSLGCLHFLSISNKGTKTLCFSITQMRAWHMVAAVGSFY